MARRGEDVRREFSDLAIEEQNHQLENMKPHGNKRNQIKVTAPIRFIAVGQSLIKRDLRGDSSREFKEIQKIIQSADIAFTNFEGTIRGSSGGWPTKNGPIHASDPVVLDTLKAMGFNTLSLSNNHAFDLGPDGILSTLEEVKKRGFLHAGIGKDSDAASKPGYMETEKGKVALISMDCSPQPDYFYAHEDRPGINRLRLSEVLMLEKKDLDHLEAICERIGYEKRKAEYIRYGFRTTFKDIQEFYGIRFERGSRTEERRLLDPEDRDRNLAIIRDAARTADFVIVYVHHHYWEFPWEVTPVWVQDFARQCIEAGANVFVSHGVPLLQAIEIYKRRPIFYGLGNFIFHSENRAAYAKDSLWQSIVAACEFDRNGVLRKIDLYPVSLGGREALTNHELPREVPHLVKGEYGEEILRHLAQLSLPFHTQIEIKGGRGGLAV